MNNDESSSSAALLLAMCSTDLGLNLINHNIGIQNFLFEEEYCPQKMEIVRSLSRNKNAQKVLYAYILEKLAKRAEGRTSATAFVAVEGR